MQRRKLDGDAGSIRQRSIIGTAADRLDRTAIRIEISLGIPSSAGALAEHVKGIAQRPRRMRPRQGGLDGLAKHKMAAHQSHRLSGGRAYSRLAKPLCQTPDRALRSFAGLDHARRHPKRPRRSIHEKCAGSGFVMDEITLAEFVLDE